MRAVIIVVEGATEEEYVKNVLRPYLFQFGIHTVTPIRITFSSKSKGGILKGSYQKLKSDVSKYLNQKDVIVTTLIDYYALPQDFPGWIEGEGLHDTDARISLIEQRMKEDIDSHRYYPYIQKHEFEAILFSDINGFEYLPDLSFRQKSNFLKIINDYPNPEEINNNRLTAPSKRILSIYPQYQKVICGTIMALQIGHEKIIQKCPRYNDWIKSLVAAMQG